MSASSDRISVSSWSLHRRLGAVWNYQPGHGSSVERTLPYGEGQIDLLALPQELKAHGIFNLEICSFHLPELSESYFVELKSSLAEAGVSLQTLLIEAGDPSHPATGESDVAFMLDWAQRAEQLGAKHARVIAGKQSPTEQNLARAAKNLSWLGARSTSLKTKLVIENWFDLLDNAQHTNSLLDELGSGFSLNGDLGNWAAPEKYSELPKIMGRAILCHAKADFVDGKLNEADFGRCIKICEEAGYVGPYTLIFDSDHVPEWDGIEIEKSFVTSLLSQLNTLRPNLKN